MVAEQDSLGLCGKTLGKFQIDALLGAGGYGTVYRAFDTLLKRGVALKILSPQDAVDSDLVERFLREARLAAKLDHPNIVRVHQVGTQDGYYYIEMELIEGKSVAELIEEHRGGLPQAQVLDLAEQIASALQAAHEEANFIHRDLKPSNVLVMNARVIRIVDFGLAKPLSESSVASLHTTGRVFLGTIAYASPEQCRGEMPDCRSDIYSFGATLYHMLSGLPPIPPAEDENELQLLNRIQTEEPVPLQERVPGIEKNLCALVMKMLAKQPGDRYPSVRAVRHYLKAIKEGRPLSRTIASRQTRRASFQLILTPRDEAIINAAQELGFLTPEQARDFKASLEAAIWADMKDSRERLLLDKSRLSQEQSKLEGRPQSAEEQIVAIERMLPDGDGLAEEVQELLVQVAVLSKRESLGRSILRRVKTIDKRLEAVKELSAAWERYAAFVKQAREGAAFNVEDEEAFAALGSRISREYPAALPLLERPECGWPVVKHCRQGLSLSATVQERQALPALETGCAAGAELLHDFQVLLEQSRRKTISAGFLRYSMAKYVGTPRRQIGVGIGLALMIFLVWGMIAHQHREAINAAYKQFMTTEQPAGAKPRPPPETVPNPAP